MVLILNWLNEFSTWKTYFAVLSKNWAFKALKKWKLIRCLPKKCFSMLAFSISKYSIKFFSLRFCRLKFFVLFCYIRSFVSLSLFLRYECVCVVVVYIECGFIIFVLNFLNEKNAKVCEQNKCDTNKMLTTANGKQFSFEKCEISFLLIWMKDGKYMHPNLTNETVRKNTEHWTLADFPSI